MEITQAQKEAEKIFGPTAAVDFDPKLNRYRIGKRFIISDDYIWWGTSYISWEDALLNAKEEYL